MVQFLKALPLLLQILNQMPEKDSSDPVDGAIIAAIVIASILLVIFIIWVTVKLLDEASPDIDRSFSNAVRKAGTEVRYWLNRILPGENPPPKQEIHHHHYAPQYDQSRRTENITDSVVYRKENVHVGPAAHTGPAAPGRPSTPAGPHASAGTPASGRPPSSVGSATPFNCPTCYQPLEAHWKVCPNCETRLK